MKNKLLIPMVTLAVCAVSTVWADEGRNKKHNGRILIDTVKTEIPIIKANQDGCVQWTSGRYETCGTGWVTIKKGTTHLGSRCRSDFLALGGGGAVKHSYNQKAKDNASLKVTINETYPAFDSEAQREIWIVAFYNPTNQDIDVAVEVTCGNNSSLP